MFLIFISILSIEYLFVLENRKVSVCNLNHIFQAQKSERKYTFGFETMTICENIIIICIFSHGLGINRAYENVS